MGPGGQRNVADGLPDKVNWLVSWMAVAVEVLRDVDPVLIRILSGLQS